MISFIFTTFKDFGAYATARFDQSQYTADGNRVQEAFFLCGSVKLPTVGSRQVLWACTGKNETFPPSTSLPVMGQISGANTASLGGHLHSEKKRARWVEGFHDDLNGHIFDLERDGLHQVVLCP